MRKGELAAAGALLLAAAGFLAIRAQDSADPPAPAVSDPNCTVVSALRDQRLANFRPAMQSALTDLVSRRLAPARDVVSFASATTTLPSPPRGRRTDTDQRTNPKNTIDKYLFQDMADAGVAPAPATTDFEFVRRIYLDLTGRIPTANQAIAFVQDTDPQKRSKLIDSLIGTGPWVDKWTVWFGDRLKNNSNNTQIRRWVPGVVAFNNYIRTSLQNNKPYDQMAREIIAAQGTDSYSQGELNFLIGGFMGGGPTQDIFDEQIAKTVDTFLGISHLECLLCHNGRGHLDQLSLWGYYSSRQEAWGMASFLSHTWSKRTPVDGAVQGNPYYWGLVDDVVAPRGAGQGSNYNYTNDYPLNTTTGNRPARASTQTDVQNNLASTTRVKPAYIFDGTSPAKGENYRAFLAKKITGDFQFARASVNYMWEYFFGIGLVTPSNVFDPDRLDPDNPPSDCPGSTPCTLQSSHPRLLNALAQDFINSGYDIRGLQREIVNSRAYQLSSRYEGTWNPANETLFARKLVRRLWSEELHDAIAQSSNVIPTYPGNITQLGSPVTAWGPVNWAMQFPEPLNTPGGGQNSPASTTFLDAFLRGNRDDQERKGEGSISQALNLMNDSFIMSRVRSNAATSLIQVALKLPDTQLVNTLYLTVLSRTPTQAEMTAALNNLKTNRTQEAQALLWSLYNSVSFVFNY